VEIFQTVHDGALVFNVVERETEKLNTSSNSKKEPLNGENQAF